MKAYFLVVMVSCILIFTGVNTIGAQEITSIKVAFIGDQGVNENAVSVLRLIESENTDMVLHQGDFDYLDDPDLWDEQITSTLGNDFPYFASVGNHDVKSWDGYQEKLQNRLDKIPNAQCSGDLGIQSSCLYGGLFFQLISKPCNTSKMTQY